MRRCDAPDCFAPAQHGSGLCWGHRKARREGRNASAPLATRNATPWERLLEAALALAEVSAQDDDAYMRARDRLRKAARAYGEALAAGRSAPHQ